MSARLDVPSGDFGRRCPNHRPFTANSAPLHSAALWCANMHESVSFCTVQFPLVSCARGLGHP
eukprot:13651774-Alexandrium_andersonii.AAC.1